MDIFGIGAPELLMIFVIALVVLGPQRLPEMARTIGKTIYEFRKISGEATSVFREVMDVAQFTPTNGTGPRTNAAGDLVQPDGLPYPVDTTGIHPMFRRDATAVVDPDLLPDPPPANGSHAPAGATPAFTLPGTVPAAPPTLWYPPPNDPNAPAVEKPVKAPNVLDYPPPFG